MVGQGVTPRRLARLLLVVLLLILGILAVGARQVVLREVADLLEHVRQVLGHHNNGRQLTTHCLVLVLRIQKEKASF